MNQIIWTSSIDSIDIFVLIIGIIGAILLSISIITLIKRILNKSAGYRAYLLAFAILCEIAILCYILYVVVDKNDPIITVSQPLSIACLALSPFFLMIFAIKIFKRTYSFRIWKIFLGIFIVLALSLTIFPDSAFIEISLVLILLIMITVIVKNLTFTSFKNYMQIEDKSDLQMKVGLLCIGASGIFYVTFLIILIIKDQTGIATLNIYIAICLLFYIITFYLGYVMPNWFQSYLQNRRKKTELKKY